MKLERGLERLKNVDKSRAWSARVRIGLVSDVGIRFPQGAEVGAFVHGFPG